MKLLTKLVVEKLRNYRNGLRRGGSNPPSLQKTMDTKSALRKVAEKINQTRRMEIMNLIESNHPIHEYLHNIRNSEVFAKGNKSKSMRKIATVPAVVDTFFTKIYGKDYYKDPSFFTKHYQEWAVLNPKHFGRAN